ncbi:CgeB family protein [Geobacter pickeringii]|uniref:CgeB family protein n=1 Tax=Geobacter pickeringii TaxID=345632 RepID=UPI000A034D3B|nr:glycosyltransferase [Geobacter pickeringii]
MKILVVGDWHSELHEEAVSNAFESLGHETIRFPWHHYFRQKQDDLLSGLKAFTGRIQNKLIAGPSVFCLNSDFLSVALSQKPDAIFIYRGTHLLAETLRSVKSKLPGVVLIGYNNDDPFADGYSKLLWRHFLAAVPVYDLMLAYRHHNLEDFRQAGAKRVELFRSWFIPQRNKPVGLTPEDLERFECDVVFAGHYEPDGREELLERIVGEGFNLRLFGPEWENAISQSPILRTLAPVVPVRGDDYNKALCGAKIALCILSKLNRDTYTRRCFEIPAAGTFMLAEYSDDLASMYREGVETEFFRSKDELINKLHHYLADDEARLAIAAAGKHRVNEDGHDVVSRVKQVLSWVAEVKQTS